MSIQAVKWAQSQKLPQTEKSVLLALAQAHSQRWGFSDLSQQKIAESIGVTRETVNRAIVRLCEKRKITALTAERKKGQWDRRVYLLNPAEGGIAAPKKPARRVAQDHTAPCDFRQTRHRVTQDHTSRRLNPTVAEDPKQTVRAFIGGRSNA